MTCLGCPHNINMGRIVKNARLGQMSATDAYGNYVNPQTFYDTASASVENIWNDAVGVWDQAGTNLAEGASYALANPLHAATALLPAFPEVNATAQAAQAAGASVTPGGNGLLPDLIDWLEKWGLIFGGGFLAVYLVTHMDDGK